MQASAFLFATDLHDEGYDQVLNNLQQRAGLQGVTMACAYHHARDIFPHNPVRKVRFLDGGTIFFQPDPARYSGLKIQPRLSQVVRETDVLAELMQRAERRGLAVRAWTVFLHNTTLGSQHPDCTIHNAFGDPYLTSLCPANPDVRAYARALSSDIARYGVQAILAESLAYSPFDHGYHHERSFIPLSPAVRFLLGLCFCDHCLAAVQARGVDGERVRRVVRQTVERVFHGEPDGLGFDEVDREALGQLAAGELGAFLEARQHVVTSLTQEVTEAVEQISSSRFTFMEMSGAAKGYATGRPAGAPAAADAWQDGVDVEAVSRACHAMEAIGYAHDPERLSIDLDAYRDRIPSDTPLAVALRPMLPDTDSVENLQTKIRIARDKGVDWVDFYHYGFVPLGTLDRIAGALAG